MHAAGDILHDSILVFNLLKDAIILRKAIILIGFVQAIKPWFILVRCYEIAT